MEGKSARERLIAIQRRLVDETKTEIYESLGSPGAELQCYYEEYQRVFQSSHSPAPREELIAEVTAADIVHFGDYHTLRESQKAPLRILRRVLAEGRRVVIATEVVHLPHQATLDAFLAGDIAEEEFLRHIGYEENWGFSWRNYRLHFDFAREQGIPMVAVNSDPAVLKDSLSFRDSIAAMRIVEALSEFPGALIAVIFGDLHMAPSHIPGRVNELLAHRKVPPRTQVVVYQNSEKIYWDLALAAIEQKTDVVRLEERKYCLINSTPLVKFQSYLNWEMNQEELEESVGLEVEPDISSNVMTEQVMQLVIAICRFLELPVEGLDDFTVHTSRDLDFLDKLEASGRFTAAEIEEIRQQVERDESYYITRERILYLGNLSMDHAAEEASHYINGKLAGHLHEPPDPRFHFYYRILNEAIGFIGSKIINHKRRCYHRREFEQVRQDCKGRRLGPRMKQVKAITRDVLQHLDFEDLWLRGLRKGYPRFRAIYEREGPVHIGATHSLGYILGDRIHAALMEARIPRRAVRELFLEGFTRRSDPRARYFEWLKELGGGG